MLDQGLISLANFGIGLSLINLGTKEEYGLYGIGYALLLLTVGVANALVTTQMSVFAPEKKANKLKSYCMSMLAGQYLIILPVWMLFIVTVFLATPYIEALRIHKAFIMTVACAALAMLFHEFMRRYFYIVSEPIKILIIDIVSVSIIFTGIFCIGYFELTSPHVVIMLFYTAGTICAGLLGFTLSRMNPDVSAKTVLHSLKEAWGTGKWALGGMAVTWMHSNGYILLLTFFVSTAAVAEANAAKLFLAPVGIISTGLIRVYMPQLAFLRVQNSHKELILKARKILIVVLLSIVLILTAIFFGKDFVLHFMYSDKYQDIGIFIIAWALVFSMQALRTSNSIILQVYKQFKEITSCISITALVSLLLGVILISIWGILGSIFAIFAGELLLSYLLWKKYRATVKR